jgi:hypothetical protein
MAAEQVQIVVIGCGVAGKILGTRAGTACNASGSVSGRRQATTAPASAKE